MIGISRGDFVGKRRRDVAVEQLGKAGEMPFGTQDLDPRDDRDRDALPTALVDEAEEAGIVEEHLGDDVIGAGIDLVLHPGDVGLQVGCLEVLLRIPGGTDAEIGWGDVDEILEKDTLVHVGDLGDEVAGIFVAASTMVQRLGVANRVAADRQQVVDAEVVELDEEVFALFLAESLTENVRYGVDLELVLNERAEAEGSRPFPLHTPANPSGCLLVDHLGGVARDVNERWPVPAEIVDQAEQAVEIAAALGRDDLKADEGFAGTLEMLRHPH